MANDIPGRATFTLALTTNAEGDASGQIDTLDGNYLDLLVIESSDLANTAVLTVTDIDTGAVLVNKTNPAVGVYAVRYSKSDNTLAALSGQSTAFRCERGLAVTVASGGADKSINLVFKHQETHPDG